MPSYMIVYMIVILFVCLGVIGLVMRQMWRRYDRAHWLLVEEVNQIGRHMLRIEDAVPINVAMQTILREELTHYHTPEVDRLLSKLGPPFTLTDEEEAELLKALEQRGHDMGHQISQSEREAARLLPMIIKRIKRDQAAHNPSAIVLFQIVSIMPPRAEESSTS